MKTKMVNVRIDEKTQEKIGWILRKRKGSSTTELIRNALEEYLSRDLTWEDIDYKLIPYLRSFLDSFKIIGVVKPSMTLAKVVTESVPILLCTKYQGKRVDFGIILKESKDDILVRVRVYWTESVKLKDDISETFFLLKRDLERPELKATVGEFFSYVKNAIEEVE